MSWHLAYIDHIHHQLEDDSDPAVTQLLGCGAENLDALRLVARQFSASGMSLQQSCETLEALIDISYDRMSRGSCWHRLFTDASILRSLVGLGSSTASTAIERLDRAIIVAGATGEGRLDLILTLIARIQSEYLPCPPSEPAPPLDAASCSLDVSLSTATQSITCLDVPPSFVTFQSRHSCQPFILRNYARSWPAINEHPWSSAAYLRSVAGPARVVPVEVGQDYRTDNWSQKLMGWDEFLSCLFSEGQDKEILYLAQHNLFTQFPDLKQDIIVPDYVYASLPAPPDYSDYKPPGNDEQLVLNGWLGPKGTVSPAHTDSYHNIFVQVVGRKSVWLAPPRLSRYMYPYTAEKHENPAANTTASLMNNTSRVDVFHDEGKDRNHYGDFWTQVVPHAISATLGPGDLLFLPAGWWHAMRAEETSFSVSMWF